MGPGPLPGCRSARPGRRPAASGPSASRPGGEALIIDIDGYEGPLHLLLALARTQKVDLLKLSITSLVDQYLAFVREARRRRFSLAADYLVMAAHSLVNVEPAHRGDLGLTPA